MKIQLNRNGLTGQVEMLLYYKVNEKVFVAKSVNMEMVQIEGHERIEPTLTFNMFEGDELLKDLLRQITDSGIKAPETAKTEGMLEATKAHLMDMRALVFGKDLK